MRVERRGPRSHMRPLVWLAAFLGGSLIGLLLRIAAFVTAASGVQRLGQMSLWLTNLAPSLDPVYTHAALRSLIDLHVQGLAIAGTPGDWLHTALPQVFADASRARWGLALVVVESGSPVLGRLLAAGVEQAWGL